MTVLTGVRTAASTSTDWVSDRQFGWLMAAFLIASYCLCLIQFDLTPPAQGVLKQIEPSTYFRNGWLILIGLSAGVMALRFRLLSVLMSQVNPWMLALLGWCFFSALWAPDPAFVLRKSMIVSGVTAMAIAFVLVAWHPRRFENVLLVMFFAIMLASVVAALAFPSYGIHPAQDYELSGTWRGVTAHKNGLGAVSASALLLVCHAWAARRVSGPRALAGAALAIFLLLMSASSTSILLSIVACSVTISILRRPAVAVGRGGAVAVGFALALIVIPLLIFLLARYGLELATIVSGWFGKDVTFSGRSDLWMALIENIQKHPLVGVGYASFWNGLGSPSDAVVRKIGFFAHGHNGYLDITNELGVVGLVLLIGFLARHTRDLILVGRVDRSQFALHAGFFVYFLTVNLVETTWFSATNGAHIVLVFSSLAVSRQLLQYRLLSARRRPESAMQQCTEPPVGGRVQDLSGQLSGGRSQFLKRSP